MIHGGLMFRNRTVVPVSVVPAFQKGIRSSKCYGSVFFTVRSSPRQLRHGSTAHEIESIPLRIRRVGGLGARAGFMRAPEIRQARSTVRGTFARGRSDDGRAKSYA